MAICPQLSLPRQRQLVLVIQERFSQHNIGGRLWPDNPLDLRIQYWRAQLTHETVPGKHRKSTLNLQSLITYGLYSSTYRPLWDSDSLEVEGARDVLPQYSDQLEISQDGFDTKAKVTGIAPVISPPKVMLGPSSVTHTYLHR